MLHLSPTNLSSSSRKQNKNKKIRAIYKKKILRKTSVQTFLESRQETGPKVEKKGADRRSNRTRHNNKRADRKMKSNDSPEIPDKGWGGGHQKRPASLRALQDKLSEGTGPGNTHPVTAGKGLSRTAEPDESIIHV